MADDKPQPKKSEDEDLAARVRDLESALAAQRAAGAPLSLIPEHGAGVNLNVAPTWSQDEQEAARKRFG